MPLMTLLAFLFLGSAFLSLWLKRDSKIWGTLSFLSVFSGVVAGNITWIGLGFIGCLALLWILYVKRPNAAFFWLLFA